MAESKEKVWVVQKRWEKKCYNTFDKVKKYATTTDKIREYEFNGSEFTLAEYKQQLERDRDISNLLDEKSDNNSYPNSHHIHILNLIKNYSPAQWRYSLNGNKERIIVEKDFTNYIRNNKQNILNFVCRTTEDYEHIIHIMNYKLIRDTTPKQLIQYQHSSFKREDMIKDYNKNVNSERFAQFKEAKENIKKLKLNDKKN